MGALKNTCLVKKKGSRSRWVDHCARVSKVRPDRSRNSLSRLAAALSAFLRSAAGRSILGVLAALSTSLGLAMAQDAPSDDQRRAYDRAFQETLSYPADLDKLFRFAVVASEAGDLEGAISSLERMLIINPDLPRVRLELGILYFRLGSYEAARAYLEAALASPALPGDVRKRAESFLNEAQRRLSPSRLTGEGFLGWRYQSNANLGPSSSNILLFGAPANLNATALGTPDWGVVSSVQLHHFLDLQTQDKGTLETHFTGYANRQFQLGTTDVSILDLNTGPRFQVLQGALQDFSLRPFLNAGYVWIYDTPYYSNLGAGLEAGLALSDQLRNQSMVRWRQQSHPDTWYLPANSQYSGTEYSASTSFELQLNNNVGLFANGSATRFEALYTATQSYRLLIGGGGVTVRFEDPVFRSGQPWRASIALAEQWWTYDMPNATVDPNTSQSQIDTLLSISLAVPLDDRTTLQLSAGRFVRSSALPNYAFENNTAMFGVSWRF